MSAKSGTRTVAWWLGWIAATILSFFVSCFFWTRVIADHLGPIDKPGVTVWWLVAVFGSWIALLVPLIIVMYGKVDKTYEDARLKREAGTYQAVKAHLGVRCVSVDAERRQLKKELSEKLRRAPETLKRGHLVTAVLKSGRRVENVFVLDRKEILGLYGAEGLDFKTEDIADIVPVSPAAPLPDFKPERWLRLDGVGNPV